MNILLFIAFLVQFVVGIFAVNMACSQRDKEVPWTIAFVLIFIISITAVSTIWLTTDNPAQQVTQSCRCDK